jgi:type IV secretion system protein TrbL
MIPQLPGPGDWIEDNIQDLAKDWLVDLAGKAGQSAQLMMEKTATFWVSGVKTPQLTQATAADPYAPADTVAYLWDHLSFYVSALAVFSVLVAAIKIAWEGSSRPARELLQSLLTWVVVSSAGVATISLLTIASDEVASYILKDAMTDPKTNAPTNFQAAFGAMFSNPTPVGGNAVAVLALMVLVFFASLAQIALLIVRGGMLFLLAGILPLAAAATNTEMGRAWLKRALSWTIAFLLYKPVAASVYATAFLLTREGGSLSTGDELVKVATGLTLCVLALFALPALMRFTAPAVAAAAGGGGGGAGLAMLGALASGARPLLAGKGGGGGGGKPPPPPSTGQKSTTSGPQGNTLPSGGKPDGGGGKPGGPAGGGSGGATSKAGPAGAIAAGIADGLKKTSDAANSAVSNAAGEETHGSAPSRPAPAPAKPGGKPGTPPGPTGGQQGKTPPPPPSAPPGPPPSTKPPAGDGPSGAQKGKQNPPNNSGGPTGGKRH